MSITHDSDFVPRGIKYNKRFSSNKYMLNYVLFPHYDPAAYCMKQTAIGFAEFADRALKNIKHIPQKETLLFYLKKMFQQFLQNTNTIVDSPKL